MATPVGATPTLSGEDLENFDRDIEEGLKHPGGLIPTPKLPSLIRLLMRKLYMTPEAYKNARTVLSKINRLRSILDRLFDERNDAEPPIPDEMFTRHLAEKNAFYENELRTLEQTFLEL